MAVGHISADDMAFGAVRGSEEAVGAAKHMVSPGFALAVLVTSQLMLILDGTIVNIALPDIQQSLRFSDAGLSWVLNAYALPFGGLLLLGGRAGDILGRRRLFFAGILLFTVASLAGGFATSSGWLLATRATQGIAAALAAPSALALITTTFTEGRERTRALGIYSAVQAAGASVGLIAGGMLTSWVSWRWVMFVNVPIGIAIVVLVPFFVQETERHAGRFDVSGALTSTVGMVSLVYGFIRASSHGWSDSLTLASFAVAVVLLASFLFLEIRARQPIMPLRLFANRNRASAYLNMLLLPAAMLGMFFFVAQFAQNVLGYSAIRAGVAFLPLTIVIFVASQVVTRLLPRFGHKPIMVTGAVLITGGMIGMTQISASTDYLTGLLGPMLMFGLGAGFSLVPLSLIILSNLEPEDSGAASGLLQTMQQVGGSLGIAVLVTEFGSASRAAAQRLPPGTGPESQSRQIMAEAMGSTLTVAALIAAAALLVTLLAIGGRSDRSA